MTTSTAQYAQEIKDHIKRLFDSSDWLDIVVKDDALFLSLASDLRQIDPAAAIERLRAVRHWQDSYCLYAILVTG